MTCVRKPVISGRTLVLMGVRPNKIVLWITIKATLIVVRINGKTAAMVAGMHTG